MTRLSKRRLCTMDVMDVTAVKTLATAVTRVMFLPKGRRYLLLARSERGDMGSIISFFILL